MIVYRWAMLFKGLMDDVVLFMRIPILPGTGITVMDAMVWSAIVFLAVKALYSIYGD